MSVKLIAYGVGALALGLGAWYVASRAGTAAHAAAQAVNPLSDQNLAYQGANAVVQHIGDNPDGTLGTWLWEVLNPIDVQREREAVHGPVPDAYNVPGLGPYFAA